jgi:hypothetical protein
VLTHPDRIVESEVNLIPFGIKYLKQREVAKLAMEFRSVVSSHHQKTN